MIKRKWTIRKRLWILSGSFIILILILSFIPLGMGKFYNSKVNMFSSAIIPSFKTLILANSMRDTLQANTYGIVFSLGEEDPKIINEIMEENKSYEKNLIEYLASLKEKNLNKNIEIELDSILKNASKYNEIIEEISNLAKKQDRKAVSAKLSEFSEQFKQLEGSMNSIQFFIEDLSQETIKKSNSIEKVSLYFNIFIISFSFLISILISFIIIKKLNIILQSVTSDLNKQSKIISKGSRNLENTSSQLAKVTAKQSSSIAQVASSMEEINSMLMQTSKHSTNNMNNVHEGQLGAKEGKEAIFKMLSAMESLQASNSRLEAISSLIIKIASKTKMINEIVSETRLLSFNASIEAARAGVHGKGFAVVAEEVGKLAALSGTSANEIRELLESSTAEVNEVVLDIGNRIKTGKTLFKSCEASFDNMVTILTKIAESSEIIVSAIREQEIGVKQTNASMRKMDQVTKETNQISNEQESDAKTLSQSIVNVQENIFTLRSLIMG